VALDVGYLEKAQFAMLIDLAQEVARVVGGLRAAVERNRDAQKTSLSPQSAARST
jgi:hypothetical protein